MRSNLRRSSLVLVLIVLSVCLLPVSLKYCSLHSYNWVPVAWTVERSEQNGTPGFMFASHWKDPYSSSSLSEIVKSSLDVEAFAQNPHRLARELILWIYQEFGYDSSVLGPGGERLPFWNDERGRFEFPD